MGALTSNRKRGDDYFKSLASISPPIEEQQPYGRLSKKPRISIFTNETTSDFVRPLSFRSVASRVSQYPDTKSGFQREVHAPVRNSRFGFSSFKKKIDFSSTSSSCCKEGSGYSIMGNWFGVQSRYDDARSRALESLRFFRKGDEGFVGKEEKEKEKEKEKDVIEIDDGGEEEEVQMEDVVVSDDSSIEEVDVSEWKDRHGSLEGSEGFKVEMVEKEWRSLDSSVVTDVSNAAEKVDGVMEKMDLMMLDQEQDESGVPIYKRLYDSSKKRDGKLNSLKFDIELNEKRSQGYHFLRSQKKEKQVKKVTF